MQQSNQYNSRIEKNKHMIENMNNYMLTNKNLMIYLDKCLKNESKKPSLKKIKFKPSGNIQTLFFPFQEDNLFWIYYIMLNGIENYKMLGEHTYKTEKEEKIKCIEKLKENKSIIKEMKSKIIDCENDLMNNKKISMSTFLILCQIKNIYPCVVYRNMYLLLPDCDKPSFIIHKVNNLFGYEPYNETLFEGIKTNRYYISNINKPIKTISNYKIDEIKNIAEALHISLFGDNQKNKTKIMLYDDIKNVMNLNIE